jgi:hypothetical protein
MWVSLLGLWEKKTSRKTLAWTLGWGVTFGMLADHGVCVQQQHAQQRLNLSLERAAMTANGSRSTVPMDLTIEGDNDSNVKGGDNSLNRYRHRTVEEIDAISVMNLGVRRCRSYGG